MQPRLMLRLFTAAALLLAGCESYVIRGKVIEGPSSEITLVSSFDSRLQQPGVDGVRIVLERDPERLARRTVADKAAGADGTFAIPIKAFGAGWMDEEWGVRAARPGLQSATAVLRLPPEGSRERLLVTLAPGDSTSIDREDLWEQYEKFK